MERQRVKIYTDKENEAFSTVQQLETSRGDKMDRKMTREELLRQWKQTRTGGPKSALQKSDPNIARPRNTDTSKNYDPKLGKRPISKLSKVGVRTSKDIENEKQTAATKRAKLDSQSSQNTDSDTGEDESFNPKVLEHHNIRNVLVTLDEGIEQEKRKQRGENVEDEKHSKKIELRKEGKKLSPIGLLQKELATRNDDINALQDRLAAEVARTRRLELQLHTRGEEADRARADEKVQAERVRNLERQLADREDAEDVLRRELISIVQRHAVETAKLNKKILELESNLNAKCDTFVQQGQGPEAFEQLQTLLTAAESSKRDLAEKNLRLTASLADEQAALKSSRESWETMIQEAENRASRAEKSYAILEEEHRDVTKEFTQVEHLRHEVEGLREYLSGLRESGIPQDSRSLADELKDVIASRDQTILTLEEANQHQAGELEECCNVIEELEKQKADAEELTVKYPVTLAHAEELQTKLLSAEVELWQVRDQLLKAKQEGDELREALQTALVENERLHSEVQDFLATNPPDRRSSKNEMATQTESKFETLVSDAEGTLKAFNALRFASSILEQENAQNKMAYEARLAAMAEQRRVEQESQQKVEAEQQKLHQRLMEGIQTAVEKRRAVETSLQELEKENVELKRRLAGSQG
ncbi:uncharacterized protein SPPG_01439 [Spizellomyces punctatus DAOM BR117]|uniref:Uncharacterized protein n=1 Tax=Spizellomyces punctatus (strain DAOM BR117) TaxID=645134 RepID=A0A0L0HRJ3_SPIPD|nr:uncharacterized protein SPPG_01439 [Spizellomyces punctatus DAOM BR117]KND03991.1 hypothetical protein SPPG_01439 [Spizellomyces punctatus DAOM BR117]|eukprot:XP_016612030.1 hypothetical protein SPPG_01439 [Spizellomyces punctatus DAOM BR117]